MCAVQGGGRRRSVSEIDGVGGVRVQSVGLPGGRKMEMGRKPHVLGSMEGSPCASIGPQSIHVYQGCGLIHAPGLCAGASDPSESQIKKGAPVAGWASSFDSLDRSNPAAARRRLCLMGRQTPNCKCWSLHAARPLAPTGGVGPPPPRSNAGRFDRSARLIDPGSIGMVRGRLNFCARCRIRVRASDRP